MVKKLKILQLSNKAPYPPKDGGAISINNVTFELLAAGHDVKVLSVNTHKHFTEVKSLPEDYVKKTGIEFIFVDTRVKPLQAALNLFGKRSYNIVRFFSADFAKRLSEILQENDFDIIQMESIFLIDYLPVIRKYSKAKIVLRAPNVEYMIWERMAEAESNPLKKLYLKLLSRRLKREETNVLNRFDAIYTLTRNDMEILRRHGARVPMTFIPTGLDVSKTIDTQDDNEEELSVFHIGALDWMPNQEGLRWFLSEVWPYVSANFPEVKFYIAGRRPPEWIENLQEKNVVVLGEVEDAGAFIKKHPVMVVPLFSGSGMRVKIIEGMMLGRAVVSTAVGAEGIIVKNGEDIMIADDSVSFREALTELLGDEVKLKSLREKAAENCRKNYSEEVITRRLAEFLDDLLK